MELCEYVCIWAALLAYRLIELFILLWIAMRTAPLILVLLWIEWIAEGTTLQNPLHKFICYFEKTWDAVSELLHWFDRQPKIGVWTHSGWELVAATRSVIGYRVKTFQPVVICDYETEDPDDVFRPDHASFVYIVEVRERLGFYHNANDLEICLTVVIWQVSLLNGGQKCVFSERFFDILAYWPPIKCFSSSGVIFVLLERKLLLVDDRQHKWQPIEIQKLGWFVDIMAIRKVASIRCLHRIWRLEDGEKRLDGWVIRVISTEGYLPFIDAQLRVSLVNTVFEIRRSGEVRQLSSEGIVFFDYDPRDEVRHVRTRSAFGVFCKRWQTSDGPSVLFDESTKSFIYCADLEELSDLDQYFSPSSPVFLNSRECIECSKDGTIYRRQLAPPTLEYTMAKTIFRANPDLRIRMNAEEFRRETGITGMHAHFRSEEKDTM